ncbi:IS110 family transposase [Streptomyces rapamycinicus]|uniref:IS110 family transposase n=1 Tax=Streptomyces rhizosphaericus TaxID=114699 RepID=A0A6G4AQ15_9ACTN|nr:IS110 family transposase [Streptomyces rhizosphaericus]
MARNWAGTDIGKAHHHTVVLNGDGEVLLSRRVVNDEPELLSLIGCVLELGEDVVWAVDVADGMACLLVNLLLNHGQTIVYLPGLAVNRASAGYRGLGKTDAKDARVIADQARMRRDLHLLAPESDLAAELRVMTDRRADLVQERTRKTNRLHAQVLSIFPALERALELTNIGPLVLLSGYQTPAALRRLGRKRLTTWLCNRKVRSAELLADTAVDAAERQHTQMPGEAAIARVICDL